ncbi:MAG: TetR/AcrR family transcriptional regulator [Lachnospiraceae bacterium]|nr:TetR/AcrR family transcriptional regulator [Lachnospiraceae bacterium]
MTERKHRVVVEIEQSFLDLLADKAFTDITVTDVVKKAGVARASFYRNFASTSDILDHILNNITTDLRDNVLPVVISNDERQWRAFLFRYIYFLDDHYKKIMSSKSTNISIILYRIADVAGNIARSMKFKNINEKYSISARIGAANSVLMHWFDSGKKETPEEIVDYLMSFILTIN